MRKMCFLFLVGGAGYVLLELLWRGRSHITMFLAGGICFLLVGRLSLCRPQLPILLRGLLGAVAITSVELAFGLLFNRSYGVWDYRGFSGNFHGQICPQFFLLWAPLSLLAGWLYQALDDNIG